MVSPNLYNMLLYRAFHARRAQCSLLEANYQTPACAFGRVPIVIYLGDFLQLKPTGSGRSLLSDPRASEDQAGDGGIPAEHQKAMAAFCDTPFCFELQATNRFNIGDEVASTKKQSWAYRPAKKRRSDCTGLAL